MRCTVRCFSTSKGCMNFASTNKKLRPLDQSLNKMKLNGHFLMWENHPENFVWLGAPLHCLFVPPFCFIGWRFLEIASKATHSALQGTSSFKMLLSLFFLNGFYVSTERRSASVMVVQSLSSLNGIKRKNLLSLFCIQNPCMLCNHFCL